MIIGEKKNFIKKLKLNSNINKFIFAKTLFAVAPNPTDEFLELMANTLVNRFLFEAELSDDIPNMVGVLTSVYCWKNLKMMDEIDIANPVFKKCLVIAGEVLNGNLNEKFSNILSFHKKLESHLLTNNVKPKFVVDGFSFFDVYV
ncbi:MAG: hypothetical protein IJ638_00535 [Alphaproteobacteria bacterium]|nr:hypothetical protein [Alphaproteobacteria bacterium]